jgi:hypothetical protein
MPLFFMKKLAGNGQGLKCLCFKKAAWEKILADFGVMCVAAQRL